MRFLFLILAFCFLLCGCKAKEGYDANLENRARFMRENRSAVRIIEIDDEGSERRVKVEGIISREQTSATFQKRQTPQVGQIWRVGTVTDGHAVWLRLVEFPVEIE